MGNIILRGNWFKDGTNFVVILTGQPQDSVEIGVGATVAKAWENREATAIQSVGRDSGEAAALRWAVGAGWVSDCVTIEEMPDHLRASHRAAGNWGQYPSNGAVRRVVERGEAEAIIWEDEDEYAFIARDQSLEDADEEAAKSVTKPVGDVCWDEGEIYYYVSCVYGTEGDDPGDSYVRVGEDELGLWWTDDGDESVRQDIRGPYNTEGEAREDAELIADDQHEGEPGEDAETMKERLLTEEAGEPDASGDWCVYWETVGDDGHVVDRYPSRDAANAAAKRSQGHLEYKHPGGNLLCNFGVRQLVDHDWITPEG
jgi:hypothetical protein